MTPAPLLVIAVGNPSRGDDALGPLLLQRLREAGVGGDHGEGLGGGDDAVELLEDFQLQVEHALDLRGRRAVLFVDAARPGHASGAVLHPISADAQLLPASHALRPQGVLQVAQRLDGTAPPAWLLAIEGQGFGLGEPLTPAAARHLEQALALALQWCRTQRGLDASTPTAPAAQPNR